MKKCIVVGNIKDAERAREGGNRFWFLNGDIETNREGQEIYIESQMNYDTHKIEDVSCLVSDMPLPVQEYIAANKQYVEA